MLEDPDAPFSLAPFKTAHVVSMPASSKAPKPSELTGNDMLNAAIQGSPDSENSGSSSTGSSGYQTNDTERTDPPLEDLEHMFVDPELRSQGPPPTHSDPSTGFRPLPFHMITTYRDDGTKEVQVYPNENGEEYNPRFFGFNNVWSPSCTLSANRVIGAFKIWPKRMVRGDDLPPFIHPHFPGMRVSSIGTMTRKPLGRMYFG